MVVLVTIRHWVKLQNVSDVLEGSYKKPIRKISKEKQEQRKITIKRKGIKQTRIGVGFKSREFRKSVLDEYLSLSVVGRYLSDKLSEEVRDKRGLSYDPMATYSPYNTFGFIAAAAGIEPAKLEQVKNVILKEFSKLHDGEINIKDFDRTKKALEVENRTIRDNSVWTSIAMASFDLMYGDAKFLDILPKKILKVSLDDIRKYCNEYIDVDKYSMVLLKPVV